ncbi:MAG: SagB/ThcOx family dehydrogenase [Candidatus Eisenbacteria bacterium]|uniref:SagB/ThcOx family dehydrogenase n=1 Tax=Eiseniibacteriota bacterium TaxID=2212470 RepID=A0A948S176_UNCEI|nr:SagB/ThcOx family dehydrogenase [Candidatus Eisenbacteria bacterium]MBU1947436.1 SagB/ThcOx family dehydrogenase [Candidatus Eisenbacteria bacterium]MBU2693314.1 SagB/ThcOx family dehydrogenase [Candidatus Eisenbacteria bacterium]
MTAKPKEKKTSMTTIVLPKPRHKSKMSLEEAFLKRRSVRAYKEDALSQNEVSNLLWAAQGITSSDGLRTAASAGARYPLEAYLVVGNVEDITPGVYKYDPVKHSLTMRKKGDLRGKLTTAAHGQGMIQEAPVSVVLAAVYERTTSKYEGRGVRYVHNDVGHAGQNICLQAVALGLGSVVVGAFEDDDVHNVLDLANDERPLYIMPVGKAR